MEKYTQKSLEVKEKTFTFALAIWEWCFGKTIPAASLEVWVSG